MAFAILSTRSSELPWQIRALRVLPVFALPALVTLLYSTCASYNRMSKAPPVVNSAIPLLGSTWTVSYQLSYLLGVCFDTHMTLSGNGFYLWYISYLAGERKDHERLERLKAERQEKINELKEKTNYYITQQLIQVISLA